MIALHICDSPPDVLRRPSSACPGGTPNFGGGAGAGVKVDPVAFLVVKDGITRVMPVAMPAMTTADRVLELVPDVMDRVENYIDKKKANTDF